MLKDKFLFNRKFPISINLIKFETNIIRLNTMNVAKPNLEKLISRINIPKIKNWVQNFGYKICKDINKKLTHNEYGPELPTKEVTRKEVLNLPINSSVIGTFAKLGKGKPIKFNN